MMTSTTTTMMMTSRRGVCEAALVTGFVVGWSACVPDNVEPCRDFVAAHNEAYEDCELPRRLDEQELCPTTLNDDGRDCSDYYLNLAKSYACEERQVIYSNEDADLDQECDVR